MSGVNRFFTISLVVLGLVLLAYACGMRSMAEVMILTVVASIGGGVVYMSFEPKEPKEG